MKLLAKSLVSLLVVAAIASFAAPVKAGSSLQVLSPNGGEAMQLNPGQPIPIKWKSDGDIPLVNLDLGGYYEPFDDNGLSEREKRSRSCFFAGVDNLKNKGEYSWQIHRSEIYLLTDYTKCKYYKLYIADSKNSTTKDVSDGYFTIDWKDTPMASVLGASTESKTSKANKNFKQPIRVITPNKSKVYRIGDSVPIRWKSDKTVSNVYVMLTGYKSAVSDDAPGTLSSSNVCMKTSISPSSVESNGKYKWKIDESVMSSETKQLCPYYKVTIVDAQSGSSLSDSSDKYFTIVQAGAKKSRN